MAPPVFAAPVAGLEDRWWLVYLFQDDRTGAWFARADSGPEDVRSARAVRARGLRLWWPDEPIQVTVHQLRQVKVAVSREGSSTLGWDDRDRRHVFGWMSDIATGEKLPYDRAWAATGFGASVRPDSSGVAMLPVRWMTHNDLDSIPPGRYRIVAQLLYFDLWTEPGTLEIVRT